MPNPVDQPNLYEALVLAGARSPGRLRLSFPLRVEGWDTQKAKGSSGGETVHNGRELSEFDAELYLWRDRSRGVDHFAGWDTFKPVLLAPIAKNAPKALDIYHPQLEGIGITSVVVRSWTEPQPDGRGGATVKIKFLEYAPPKPKAAGKPGGSKSGGAGGGPGGPGGSAPKEPDPNQDLKDAIAAKTEEFNAL